MIWPAHKLEEVVAGEVISDAGKWGGGTAGWAACGCCQCPSRVRCGSGPSMECIDGRPNTPGGEGVPSGGATHPGGLGVAAWGASKRTAVGVGAAGQFPGPIAGESVTPASCRLVGTRCTGTWLDRCGAAGVDWTGLELMGLGVAGAGPCEGCPVGVSVRDQRSRRSRASGRRGA